MKHNNMKFTRERAPTRQWRIQDFPLGGVHPLGGAWTSDVGAFW